MRSWDVARSAELRGAPAVLRPLTVSVCCAPSLYSRGIIMGYKGAKNSQISHTSLLKIEGVNTPEDTQFYLGKVCASFACCGPHGARASTLWPGC